MFVYVFAHTYTSFFLFRCLEGRYIAYNWLHWDIHIHVLCFLPVSELLKLGAKIKVCASTALVFGKDNGRHVDFPFIKFYVFLVP